MGLKDLLELLYTSHNRFHSIQLTWKYWYRFDMMNEIGTKWAAQHPPGSVNILESKSVKDSQNENELRVNWRVWWQKPSCWRDEHEIEGHGTTIRIACEDRWWSFNSANLKLYTNVVPQEKRSYPGASTSEHAGTYLSRVEDMIQDIPLIDPSFLLASHELQLIGSTVHSDREAWYVRAVYRKGKELIRDAFFWGGADDYDLLVDKERGILLRYAARLREEEFAVASVDRVVFDKPIPESVFNFTPPPNASIEIVF